MKVYRVYVPKENDVLSEAELIKHFREDRTAYFEIKEKFPSNYDLRSGDLLTLDQDSTDILYKVKVVIVQQSQISLLCETVI